MEDTPALIANLIRRVTALEAAHKTLTARHEALHQEHLVLSEKVSEIRDHQDGMNDTLAGHHTELEVITAKLGTAGTNRSAATKRPMTDGDALEVLTGRFKDMKHKEAGAGIGLTYAQVYSCRCEYTFKDVHAKLRKEGWKNPWARA